MTLTLLADPGKLAGAMEGLLRPRLHRACCITLRVTLPPLCVTFIAQANDERFRREVRCP